MSVSSLSGPETTGRLEGLQRPLLRGIRNSHAVRESAGRVMATRDTSGTRFRTCLLGRVSRRGCASPRGRSRRRPRGSRRGRPSASSARGDLLHLADPAPAFRLGGALRRREPLVRLRRPLGGEVVPDSRSLCVRAHREEERGRALRPAGVRALERGGVRRRRAPRSVSRRRAPRPWRRLRPRGRGAAPAGRR